MQSKSLVPIEATLKREVARCQKRLDAALLDLRRWQLSNAEPRHADGKRQS